MQCLCYAKHCAKYFYIDIALEFHKNSLQGTELGVDEESKARTKLCYKVWYIALQISNLRMFESWDFHVFPGNPGISSVFPCPMLACFPRVRGWTAKHWDPERRSRKMSQWRKEKRGALRTNFWLLFILPGSFLEFFKYTLSSRVAIRCMGLPSTCNEANAD